MEIEKNGQIYVVTETEKGWVLKLELSGVSAAIQVSKVDCPTFEELRQFVFESATF